MNKAQLKIKKLQSKINPLQKEIYEIQEREQLNIQLPKCRKLVGVCLKSSYDDFTFAKILEFVEPKNGYSTFIMEYIYVNKAGIASIQLYDQAPYLNKEWWDSEIPMSGWEKITEEQYEIEKTKVYRELSTREKLKKTIKSYK